MDVRRAMSDLKITRVQCPAIGLTRLHRAVIRKTPHRWDVPLTSLEAVGRWKTSCLDKLHGLLREPSTRLMYIQEALLVNPCTCFTTHDQDLIKLFFLMQNCGDQSFEYHGDILILHKDNYQVVSQSDEDLYARLIKFFQQEDGQGDCFLCDSTTTAFDDLQCPDCLGWCHQKCLLAHSFSQWCCPRCFTPITVSVLGTEGERPRIAFGPRKEMLEQARRLSPDRVPQIVPYPGFECDLLVPKDLPPEFLCGHDLRQVRNYARDKGAAQCIARYPDIFARITPAVNIIRKLPSCQEVIRHLHDCGKAQRQLEQDYSRICGWCSRRAPGEKHGDNYFCGEACLKGLKSYMDLLREDVGSISQQQASEKTEEVLPEEEAECAICLDMVGHDPRVRPCETSDKHVFHVQCWGAYERRCGSEVRRLFCPLCMTIL